MISDTFWKQHAELIDNHSWLIVILFFTIAGASLYYSAHNLGVNSDTSEMFDESLPFREQKNRYNELFPLNRANITIVIESDNPDMADNHAATLADSLNRYDDIFTEVYLPGSGPYFKQNQFLFLSPNKLDTLTSQLEQSAQLFSALAQDYSMKGLFRVINDALTYADSTQLTQLDPLLSEIDTTINSHLSGEHYTTSWQRMMDDSELTQNPGRRFIQVKPKRNFDKALPAKTAIEKARSFASQFENENQATVRLTGRVVMSYEEMQSVITGTATAGLLALILVSVTLWIGLRSFRLIITSILALIIGLSLTVGFSAVAIGQLNMISVAFAVLYIGLGIDYAIHFALKFKEFRYHNYNLTAAFKETFSRLSPALIMSTLSTSFAFFSFIPTSFDGVSELGLIAGFGMFISLLITFTFLPALLKLFRSYSMSATEVTLSAPYAKTITPLLNRNARSIKILGLVSTAISIVLIFFIEFDYNPINLRDAESESIQTLQMLMDDDRFSPWTIEVIAEDSTRAKLLKKQLSSLEKTERAQTIFSFIPNKQPEKLKMLKKVRPAFESIPPLQQDQENFKLQPTLDEMEFYLEQVDFYESSSPAMINLKNTVDTLLKEIDSLHKKEDKIHQLQQLEDNLLATLPELLANIKTGLRASPVTFEDLPNELRDRWISPVNGKYRVEISPKSNYNNNNEQLRAFASDVRSHTDAPTGSLITAIESGDAVVEAFQTALIYAFVVITLMIFLFLRNIKETLYILTPLTLAGIMTGAAMVVFDIHFNFANIIAIPMIFGLGVDNGIHIVHQARNISEYTPNLLNTTTARAITFSALTTLFSFGNLAFSPHAGTASLGFILTLGLLAMLFTTLILLPAFMTPEDPET